MSNLVEVEVPQKSRRFESGPSSGGQIFTEAAQGGWQFTFGDLHCHGD